MSDPTKRRANKFSQAPLDVRFWEKVEKGPDCWTWTGALTSGGYGSIWNGGKSCLAHRLAYQLTVGPVPDGLELDHLCRNTRCVNPEHLEPVARAEHAGRGLPGLFGRTQRRVLFFLADGPRSARQLENASRLTEKAARQACDRLRSRGFVDLVGRDDRSCQMYGLTERGAVLAASFEADE